MRFHASVLANVGTRRCANVPRRAERIPRRRGCAAIGSGKLATLDLIHRVELAAECIIRDVPHLRQISFQP
jgi:hypothetical protein